MESSRRRIFIASRFATEMPPQFNCRSLLLQVPTSLTARVISKFSRQSASGQRLRTERAGMGAVRRVDAWPRKLSRETNYSRELARPGVHRFERKSFLRPDVLVEPASTERSRDRSRKRVGPEMATRTLDRHLRLPSSAARHGRRARFEL